MTNIVRYNESGGRGPSTKLWTMGAPPNGELFTNLERGAGFFDDFLWLQPTADCYTLLKADSGATSAPIVDILGGVTRLTTGATDNNEVAIGFGQATTQALKIDAGTGRCFFEARVRFNSVTNDVLTMLLGLAEEASAAANLLADASASISAIASKDFVGFGVWQDDGDSVDTVYRTAGQTAQTVKAGAFAIVADTWYKLGLNYDGIGKLTFFKDGVALADTVATETATVFPDGEEMNPILYVKTSSGVTCTVDIDWWAWAQEIV